MRFLSVTAGLAVVLWTGGIRADDDREFGAKLLGSGEVPAVQTNATGRVEIAFNEDETSCSSSWRSGRACASPSPTSTARPRA
jgi:hypothetical protein